MSYLHEIFEFYEEILTCRYPYACFKTVYVDEAYVQVSSYASMSIFRYVYNDITGFFRGQNGLGRTWSSTHAVQCTLSM